MVMALTQMQIIQSLGEAMSWFERELNWGVPPTELRHLSGRIGELYAALITSGQMATSVNQAGYDVVSATGEHVSVKTEAQVAEMVEALSKIEGVIDAAISIEDETAYLKVDNQCRDEQALNKVFS